MMIADRLKEGNWGELLIAFTWGWRRRNFRDGVPNKQTQAYQS